MTRMRVTSTAEAITTVALEEDSVRRTALQLAGHLRELLGDGRTLVVDVTGLHGLSTAVVCALLGTRRHATLRGSRIVLRASDVRSDALVRRSALDRVFDVIREEDPPSSGGRQDRNRHQIRPT